MKLIVMLKDYLINLKNTEEDWKVFVATQRITAIRELGEDMSKSGEQVTDWLVTWCKNAGKWNRKEK